MSMIREALQEAQNSAQIPLEELQRMEDARLSNGVEFGLMPSLAEDIRTLRENIELLSGRGKTRLIGITSAAPREGTSTIAAFLAVSICNGECAKPGAGDGESDMRDLNTTFFPSEESDGDTANRHARGYAAGGAAVKNVLLIDANFRRPSIHAILGLKRKPGLNDVLHQNMGWHKALQQINNGSLGVLTAGMPSANPSDILSTPRVKRLLDELRDRFKRIIIDLPPVTSSIETLRLGQWIDGIVYVVHAGGTRIEVAQEALAKLTAANARVLGIVLNRRQYFIPERLYSAL